MMTARLQYVLVFSLMALILITSGLQPATAQESEDYSFTVVGGVDEPVRYEDQSVEGFIFSDMTYHSRYPDGMVFEAVITPPEGVVINQVTLFYTFETGKGSRVQAERGENANEWIARPYENRGLPPWHKVDAYWGVRTDTVNVDSSSVHAVYYDATREWYRAESEDVIVYWYGMPETLGHYVLDGMARNHDRYLTGFGEALPFRPMAVIFPPGPEWNEYRGDSTVDDTRFGFTGTTIEEAGSTIQRVRSLEPAEIRKDCIWNPQNPNATYQMELAASTVTHEVAHLYQQETGVTRGPAWWIEGQATFFEVYEEYPIHERVRTIAKLRGGELPTLQGEGPSRGTQITYEDGCTHLGYDMGASFMLWLTDNYGGIDAYRAAVEEMRHGATMPEALQTVTGKSLLDLENEWRAFLDVAPVPEEVLDPSANLAAPAEPYFAKGDSVVLPAMPLQPLIYSKPTELSIANRTCFGNTPVTILQAGNDGTTNWYEIDCMGLVGWMNQGQLAGPQ